MAQMTEYEERLMRQQVQQLINSGQLPPGASQVMSGTENPYAREAANARAAVSTKGRSAQLKSQQAMANKMRTAPDAKGRTVGPYGVYMAPNIGDVLASGTKKLTGGFMERGMEDKYAALDAADADKAAAMVELKQMDLADARNFQTDERVAGEGFRTGERVAGQEFTGDQNAINNAFRGLESAMGRESQEGIAQGRIDADVLAADVAQGNAIAQDWEEGQFTNVKTNEPTIIATNPNTGAHHLGGKTGPEIAPEVFATSFQEYTAPTVGGSSATLAKYGLQRQAEQEALKWQSEVGTQAAIDDIGIRMGNMTNILNNPDLENFTGWTNVKRIMAPLGIGEDAWKGQAIDQQLKHVSVAGVAEMASIFKPMSDTDLKYLLSGFPEASSEARSDVEKSNLDKGWAAAEDKLDADVATAAYRQGIPVEDAASIGMDKEELTYMYAQIRKMQGQ